MSELLLVGATEELQPLALELESAGFHITACSLADAVDLKSTHELCDALIFNLMDRPVDASARALLRAGALPERAAVIAILRPDQLPDLEPSLPLDELVVYPPAGAELVTRVRRAIWRRTGAGGSDSIRCGDLIIEQATYKVFLDGRPLKLTYKEYELLRFLALNGDKVCTRETLLNRVWGYDFYGGARTVDVHIRRLRSKIEHRGHTFIETVRNVGYRFHAG